MARSENDLQNGGVRLIILMTLTSRPFFREKINRYVSKGCFDYNRHATFSSLIQADSIVFLWKTNAYGSFQEVTRASTLPNLQYGFINCTNFRVNSYTIRGLPPTFQHVKHTQTLEHRPQKLSPAVTNTVTLIKYCHGACRSVVMFPLSVSSDVTSDPLPVIPMLHEVQPATCQFPSYLYTFEYNTVRRIHEIIYVLYTNQKIQSSRILCCKG